MERVFNFSAGPAAMPLEVLQQAASEMTNYNGTTMSVMEMSHRSKDYEPIITGAEQLLRQLMEIPDNYKVLLFLLLKARHALLIRVFGLKRLQKKRLCILTLR